MDIAHWAGLGGVRFIPSDFIDKETGNLVEIDQEQLNIINQAHHTVQFY